MRSVVLFRIVTDVTRIFGMIYRLLRVDYISNIAAYRRRKYICVCDDLHFPDV